MKTIALFILGLLLVCPGSPAAADANPLEDGFTQPPADARPWVYWFWLNGNITREGITTDLEAMKRVGIGGVLIMEVDQGAPVGPVDFMSSSWRELFQHVVAEARRLGLEVNMNNDAGWNGSGGPWIKPEQSMQKVVWSETDVTGPRRFEEPLPQPPTVAGYYRDIVTLAFPAAGPYRIGNIQAKAAFQVGGAGPDNATPLPPDSVIPRGRIVDLTDQVDAAGRLRWEVPDGGWTVLRVGHTSTGVENAPAPATGRGLECDKLSREGIEANFAGMMAKLVTDNAIPANRENPGLAATHIDSWENGSQNWTARMREEFQQRRGYDLLPFLPVMTGRVVDSLEISERFLWDLRKTISELVVENYAGRMRELAHAQGLRFTVEAYGSPCDAIPYGGQSDEPMGEFWTPNGGAIETCKGMASSAHIYGKRIVGAEAFTSGDQERWREHPAVIKALGDRAFCEGINRFVFHRYALQPWAEDRRPGMTMGPWGQHYERTQTWWEQSAAWHRYLARCQYLLRQGRFVADICYLQSEDSPQGFSNHPRQGYDWDECGADAVLTRMSVQDGRIALPDGMSYRVLVLPSTGRMTPALLRKIKDLVEAGATVIGAPPRQSPSLSRYPECDQEVKQLAAELWGDASGSKITERAYGKGRVVWTTAPEKYLDQSGVSADFTGPGALRFIHRRTEDTDIYFVANTSPRDLNTTGVFRIQGKVPELWWPDSGRIERAPLYREEKGLTTVSLRLEPSGSVFVIFQKSDPGSDPVVTVTRDGQSVLSAIPAPPAKIQIQSARYGDPSDPRRVRDVRDLVQDKVDQGETDFVVLSLAEGNDPAPGVLKTLAVDYTIEGRPYSVQAVDPDTIHISEDAVSITVEKARYGVLDDPQRTRDVRGKLQRLADAGESRFPVARMAEGDDPAFLVVKMLELEYTRDGQRVAVRAQDPDLIDLKPVSTEKTERIAEAGCDSTGQFYLDALQTGRYELTTATGKQRAITVDHLPESQDIPGPWEVHFAPGWGAPGNARFDSLISWTNHPDPGIQCFSGAAVYTRTFTIPSECVAANHRMILDLGQVEVMAEVKLNDRNLGTLWKPPFRLDITEAAREGTNRLEVMVVNLWPNRLIGDENLPEDSERNPDGTLIKWPQWLWDGKPSPTGRFTFTSWRLWKKSDALLPSGLLGPVRLQPARRVRLD